MILIVGFIALNLVVVALIVRFVQELSPSYRVEARGVERFLIEVTQAYLRLVLGLLIHAAGFVLYALLVLEAATRAFRRFAQISYATIAREPVRDPIGGLPFIRLPSIRLSVIHLPRLPRPRFPRVGRRQPFAAPDGDLWLESEPLDVSADPVPTAAALEPFANLFDLVVGNERAKTIVRAALRADQPVHVLLTGPSSAAKAQMLAELGRLPGAEVYSGSAGGAGLAVLLAAHRPRFLVVEDLIALAAEDQRALGQLLGGGGAATQLSSGPAGNPGAPTRVLAGARDTERLAASLRAGFASVEVLSGTVAEFVALTRTVLVEREGLEPDLAHLVAREVLPYSLDPRDAVRVARLARLADPTKARPDDVPAIVGGLFAERGVRALGPAVVGKR